MVHRTGATCGCGKGQDMTMTQPKQTDKAELMMQLLDTQGVKYRPGYMGWQTISCPNPAGHVHGDRNPSARVNLTHGSMNCMGCGLKGDAYSVVMVLMETDFRGAVELLGAPLRIEESDFLI